MSPAVTALHQVLPLSEMVDSKRQHGDVALLYCEGVKALVSFHIISKSADLVSKSKAELIHC